MLVLVSYAPKANSQSRFAHGLQVKTEILHTKVIRSKVVEEIELIQSRPLLHNPGFCDQTYQNQGQFVPTIQNKFISKPL